jgi:hypothetical protein
MPRTKKIKTEEIIDDGVRSAVLSVEEDLSKYAALEALQNSEGGIILISTLKQDIIGIINDLKGCYRTASHTELIALISKLEARVDILRSITRAKKNYDLANDYLDSIIS